MLIRVASDLHLEAFRGTLVTNLAEHFLQSDERDCNAVLVLAGDITPIIPQLRDFLKVCCARFLHVVYIPGNHEYYRSDYDAWNLLALRELDDMVGLSAIIGAVGSRQFNGVRFLAGTLWGDGGSTPDEQAAIGQYLNDFRLIVFDTHAFTVADMAGLHSGQRDEFARLLDGAMPTVVVTHHMPSYTLSHPRFGNACTGGFAGKCDDLMHGDDAPTLWIHGHTHDTFDRVIGKTRIVCNPAGYRGEWNTEHNQFFREPKFVEVPCGVREGGK